MKNPSRSYFLWISATALSGMLYFFAFHFFSHAFPIIHLDITMDLEQALEQADVIAQKNNIGPSKHHNAAMFHTDTNAKTFIELEAGGKDAFVAMMEQNLYMPYTWQIRHFKEHEKNEATIIFTPDGKPYGFVEAISENIPGAALLEKDARHLAEKEATTNWSINFNDYALVEASQKTEISKRIDHAFVYERTEKKIGEGLYRLKIVVCGDKVTELNHFIKVPEAFTRRYNEMRSANTTIAWAANLLMALLYLLGGCGIGLYWILRRRWYIFKQPLLWAFILAFIGTLASINQLPFLWMHYNNAYSINGFLAQLCIRFFISLLAQTAAYTIIIMAAESLTRRAFGNHPQLWSIWSTENSSSYAILGRTYGGYLLVGFNCAFVIAFYLLSLRYLGWWSPSEMLFDPNILATYVPWFSPLARSLNAGFIEECLFRAIPLAGAALLGTHFGKKNWWIAAAFILQAIVFGAAHANYPMQPSYARLIELLIPSFIWGATYLKFGLLPTIIAHFVYDVIWFSLPIFISHLPDAFTYKVIISIGALLPLLFVAYARLKKGLWIDLPESAKNISWQPCAQTEEQHKEHTAHSEVACHTPVLQSKKLIVLLGIAGLIAWLCITPFVHDGVTITGNRADAVAQADTFLQQKNAILSASYKTLPLIFTHYKLIPQIANQHKFIWKKGKKELYHALLGTYLHPAHWTIRYAQFDGDIIARAEEHKVMFYNNSIWRYYHQLPESLEGAHLTQQQARAIAHTTLQEQFNLDPAQLIEISATQAELPHRTNWSFVFSNEALYPLATGQARISILIAGDSVVDAVRTIHVPEEWERKEQNKHNILNIVLMIFALMFIFSVLFGIVVAWRQKKTFLFSKKLFFTLFVTIATISLVDIFNAWPSIIGAFNTSLPLINQLFQLITSMGFVALLKSALYALIISYALSYTTHYRSITNLFRYDVGICSGLFVAGVLGCAQMLIPINMPLWPNYESLGCAIPPLASLLSAITHYIQITITFSLLFMLIDIATAQWQKNRIFFTLFAALCGMEMVNISSLKALPQWIIVGTVVGLIILELYKRILRYNYSLIPLATGSFALLHIIRQGVFNAYPGAILEAVVSACAVALISALWHWHISEKNK